MHGLVVGNSIFFSGNIVSRSNSHNQLLVFPFGLCEKETHGYSLFVVQDLGPDLTSQLMLMDLSMYPYVISEILGSVQT